jgi:hypothetical protein
MMKFPIYGKIKNVPNHQPDAGYFRCYKMSHDALSPSGSPRSEVWSGASRVRSRQKPLRLRPGRAGRPPTSPLVIFLIEPRRKPGMVTHFEWKYHLDIDEMVLKIFTY